MAARRPDRSRTTGLTQTLNKQGKGYGKPYPAPLAAHQQQNRYDLGGDPVRRADAARWKQAASLVDLGECVVAWLNGQIKQTPGHLGPPDAETIPLIPALTVINRAGFITDNSQRAESRNGRTWNTWVCGFASDEVLARLDKAVDGTPLIGAACRGVHHECWRVADLWWHCPWKDCTGFWSDRCPRVADELWDCWYVTISDPEPGRNDLLWPVLERIAR